MVDTPDQGPVEPVAPLPTSPDVPAPPAATPLPRTKKLAVAFAGAALLLVVGSFLPWAKLTAVFVGTVSKSGIDGGDGWGSVIAGIIFAAVAWNLWTHGAMPFRARLLPIIAALGTAGFVGFEWHDTAHKVSRANDAASGYGTASIGAGIWVLVVGAAVALVAAFLFWSDTRAQTTR